MTNINDHGKKFIEAYLMEYTWGVISFSDVCFYVGCCFDDRAAK